MHCPNGHINHFWNEVIKAVKEFMKGCKFQQRVKFIEEATKLKMAEAKAATKVFAASSDITKRLRQV